MSAFQFLHNFASAQQRMSEMTEVEVHRDDERPQGDGWVCTKYDPLLKIGEWERTRWVRSAS